MSKILNMEKITPKKIKKPKEAKHILEKAMQCCADCAYFKWSLLMCTKTLEKITLDRVYEPIECKNFDFK